MLEYSTFCSEDGKFDKIVFLLHGYGSNKNDLISIAPDLAKYLHNALFISPNAIHPFEGVFDSYQWFSLEDRSENMMYSGVSSASQILERFIEECLENYKLSYERIAIFGFSQGGMMATHYAYRKKPCIAAAISASGIMISPAMTKKEIVSKPRTLLIHGDQDDIIPISAMKLTFAALKDMGVDVSTHISRGLAHGIDQQGVVAAGQFLKDSFS